ncbi:MAG: FHA domain-containing protein [Jaaginema sp. PMC 1079.18]|nr:FHA domain-containing protein [Jaaginema sp. PMC 1080.18]MEC4853167.1 FHA domain-containing protein [Jaaginema sp. PMC 1079.18]MEC4868623.1 FHA domain-containing protein [Jaaginema sp. PMC 1078.18]
MFDLEEKLRLYQVFSKLYEHHPTLLNEILQLENTTNQPIAGTSAQYLTGVVSQDSVYVMTNLMQGHSQKMLQSQGLWTIGRGSKASIKVLDERVSRHHAVIEYRPREGFYLSDLGSTNGTFVNQELITQPILLQDGDRVRLGTLIFSFFCCQESCQSDLISPEILARIRSALSRNSELEIQEKATFAFFSEPASLANLEDQTTPLPKPQLTLDRQAEILDRFFKN